MASRNVRVIEYGKRSVELCAARAVIHQLAKIVVTPVPTRAPAASATNEWPNRGEGRREPNAAARTLIKVAEKHPKVLRELVA